jgi:hypothetical protein
MGVAERVPGRSEERGGLSSEARRADDEREMAIRLTTHAYEEELRMQDKARKEVQGKLIVAPIPPPAAERDGVGLLSVSSDQFYAMGTASLESMLNDQERRYAKKYDYHQDDDDRAAAAAVATQTPPQMQHHKTEKEKDEEGMTEGAGPGKHKGRDNHS